MNYKTLKELQDYYTEVELHLFKSKKTFKEFLLAYAEDEEMQKELGYTKEDILNFLNNVAIDAEANTTDKNILVKHNVANNYEVLVYNLKDNQSYTEHKAVAKRYIQSNSSVLKGDIAMIILGGIFEVSNNTRVYLFINKGSK